MRQPLPPSGFEWAEDCNRLTETIADHPDGPEGYILEVVLEYREELHNTRNAYPLAPKCMMAEKVDIRVSAQPRRCWGGTYQGSNTGTQHPQQEELCALLPQPAAVTL